jgi:hypothetical protein
MERKNGVDALWVIDAFWTQDKCHDGLSSSKTTRAALSAFGSSVHTNWRGNLHPAPWEGNDIDRDAETISRCSRKSTGGSHRDNASADKPGLSLFGDLRQDIQVQAYRLSYWARPSQVWKWLQLSYPCNRPWRPIGLWDVGAPTFSRQSAHSWR